MNIRELYFTNSYWPIYCNALHCSCQTTRPPSYLVYFLCKIDHRIIFSIIPDAICCISTTTNIAFNWEETWLIPTKQMPRERSKVTFILPLSRYINHDLKSLIFLTLFTYICTYVCVLVCRFATSAVWAYDVIRRSHRSLPHVPHVRTGTLLITREWE